MTSLPRSQGVRPGVIGLISLIAVCLAGIAYVTSQLLVRPNGWAGIPFLILLTMGIVSFVRGLVTRIRTLTAVNKGDYAIQKTLSLTEAFVNLHGMSPQEALHRCFDEMDAANGYEGRVMEANRLTALLKRTFARSHVRCSVSVVENSLRISFELVEGGAIWADGGRFEREIHRLARRLHSRAQ
ncbi:hypothetical protein GCM10007170_10460 [Arthrobacter liuii]|uniref:Uncharacterized protein n=2 Tax=Arthrobacter liuii TaxID=1476996 RepID=A0ABQ2AN33_9MICC|nr:hypothetical protein GCM10007170_10460 [Arthrobacter liuii]